MKGVRIEIIEAYVDASDNPGCKFLLSTTADGINWVLTDEVDVEPTVVLQTGVRTVLDALVPENIQP